MIKGSPRLIISLLVIFSHLNSCRTSLSSHAEYTGPEEKGNNILFVNLKIIKDHSGKESIELVSKIWSPGVLKKDAENYLEPAANILICEFLDKNEILLKSVRVQNPLNTTKEVYSTDGSIKRNQVIVGEAYFTIRTEVSLNAIYLQVVNENDQKLCHLKLQ
jgi:predicted RNA methylase